MKPARFSRTAILAACAVGALFAGGCNILPQPGPDPTRYFVLTDPAPGEKTFTRAEGGLVIGLRTLDLPGYLKSRSMIVRDGANEIAYQDYARWAEPLEVGLGRALRLHLQDAPDVARLYAEPFPFDRMRDYDVGVRIVRCEGAVTNGRGVARLTAAVEIIDVASNRIVARMWFKAPERAWDGRDFGALARLLSEAATELGDAINQKLADLPKPEAAGSDGAEAKRDAGGS